MRGSFTMPRKKKKIEPMHLMDYVRREYRIDEDSCVFSVNGDETHLGTLVGFVTEDGFHGLYRNSVRADDLKIGTVKDGDLEVEVCKEPGVYGKQNLNYNAMIIRKPEDSFMADLPFYVIRVRKV
jgi:hypothetical protein